MAAALVAGTQTSVVRGDVALTALDAEAQAVVGSFTADGLTFAIDGAGQVALVAVAPTEGFHSDADTEGASAEAAEDATLHLPAAVSHDGIDYALTRIAPLALDGAGIAAVSIPDTVSAIDPSAALGCESLAAVAVSEANPFFAAFDGYLTDKALTSILLVPEGRIGQIRIPSTMATIDPRAFSHCARIDALVVDADCPGLASWDGSLYTKDLTELLRVPAGATELTLPPECAAIGPSALSGCTELRSIDARGTVASIAPSAFGEIEEVEALPAAAVSSADEAAAPERPAQVTGLVAVASNALSSVQVDKAAISVTVPEGSDASAWRMAGFAIEEKGNIDSRSRLDVSDESSLQAADTSRANGYRITATFYVGNGDTLLLKRYDSANKLVSSQDVGPSYTLNANGSVAAVPSLIGFHLTEGDPGYDYGQVVPVKAGYSCIGWVGSATVNAEAPSFNVRDGEVLTAVYGAPYNVTINAGADAVLNIDRYWGDPSGEPIYYQRGVDSLSPWFSGSAAIGIDQSYVGYWEPADNVSGWYYKVTPKRRGYYVAGWTGLPLVPAATLTPQWEPIEYDVSFDVDSEPNDGDYPGVEKPDETANVESGQVGIEDPKRPGYVFEGWVIPNANGTEAVDQELVYQGDDGKWYVDASKLPDYADSDGKVELTARWTSIISVDVPSSVTFYADLVTGQQDPQGEKAQASREGAASGAFGQSKVENQSEVDLRIVGLESSAVKTTDATLGADSVLKKADAATPSTSTQKLLSLYPSTKQWTADELQNPDAVGGTKATTAVDFDLDDILLEKSFAADDFTIAAGGTLNMGYRLNLSETGQQLDYDKLSTLSEGQSAAIANVSYTFAGDAPLGPTPSGDETDPLYVTVDEAFITANGLSGKAPAGTYGLADIKAAARDLSNHGDDPIQSAYYALYKALLDKQVTNNGAAGSGPYFQLKVDGIYLPLQLIGICQDTKSDGTGKAGLTFQMRDIYAFNNVRSAAAGGGAFNYTYMNSSSTNSGGWSSAAMRSTLRSVFWDYLPAGVQAAIAPVDKYQQLPGGTTSVYLQKTTDETVWLPSMYETFGVSFASYNESEALTTVSSYAPFQYMAYQGNGGSATNARAVKSYNGSATNRWLRSAVQCNSTNFCGVTPSGARFENIYGGATTTYGTTPCFCL